MSIWSTESWVDGVGSDGRRGHARKTEDVTNLEMIDCDRLEGAIGKMRREYLGLDGIRSKRK